ncbi:MAG TPA: hypothetical protein VM529_02245 [Gemmata sp.]|nr:hypothetical protein [Gemmata sp.]
MPRLALLATLACLFTSAAAVAGPRDDLLRLAPADSALILVVQNAGRHAEDLAASPFAEWFPTTAVGKKLIDSPELKQFGAAGASVFAALGTTPRELLRDVLGDAVAFAYSPPAGREGAERALLLIRPGKREALEKLVEKLNDLQSQGGEVKKIEERRHADATYFARETAGGGSQFYCFRGDVFAFSTSEDDVRAFIARDKTVAPAAEKEPALVGRMKELGVADAAAVLLVNPRALDAEVRAHAAAAGPDARRFLAKFEEVWKCIDSAAVYLALGDRAEVGVSLRFRGKDLPDDARKFLAGLRGPAAAEALIPADAMFGAAGHWRAAELLDLVEGLAPGPAGVREWLQHTVGPIVGREEWPLVLDALGPNWAVWAAPPQKGAFLPTVVAAVELTGPDRVRAEVAAAEGLRTAFALAMVAYNASHPAADQIKIAQEKDPKSGVLIRSMVNDAGFPPGFRPSFAVRGSYLVLATHPDAILRFDPEPAAPEADGPRTLARFSGTRSREYLRANGEKLAQFLHDLGAGGEAELKLQIDGIADVLELIDAAELVARARDDSLRVAVRVTPAKPLKPVAK